MRERQELGAVPACVAEMGWWWGGWRGCRRTSDALRQTCYAEGLIRAVANHFNPLDVAERALKQARPRIRGGPTRGAGKARHVSRGTLRRPSRSGPRKRLQHLARLKSGASGRSRPAKFPARSAPPSGRKFRPGKLPGSRGFTRAAPLSRRVVHGTAPPAARAALQRRDARNVRTPNDNAR